LEIKYNLVGTRISCKIFFSCDTDVEGVSGILFIVFFFILLLTIFCSM